jgi:LVIVD repeat
MVLAQLSRGARALPSLSLAAALLATAACGGASASADPNDIAPAASMSTTPPSPDPRVGLRAGQYDAAQAIWNLRLLSATRPAPRFTSATHSDLAFTGKYAIQGSYSGWEIWDISNPRAPSLATAYYCPASQSDVSVYKNLLFISGEGLSGRLDCGDRGVQDPVSKERLRGLRIFDISDIRNPKNVGNVQTCRGSHTHTVLVDPKDSANVYVYISGSSAVRSAEELPGCINESPEKNPNSALFRIEVIKVPVAHPEQAAIVSSPRIFNDLKAPPRHGATAAERAAASQAVAAARAQGAFVVTYEGEEMVVRDRFIRPLLDSIVKARGGTGNPTAADTATLRPALQGIINRAFGEDDSHGPTQCHDITVYPAIGRAGGACEGYGMLLDITNPTNPVRIGAVADSNFSYWHSATFNNDGTKILFSDEWGGGGQPKCRATDPREWGADAIFTIENGQMQFQSYYKLPAPQTQNENCVAHNGSLIPIPGRDVMVQAWYQGGISVFDWTDAKHPREIAFFDRGPVDSTRMGNGGVWSVYWYNGVIVSSEISRGLDIHELVPSGFISQNEIDAAKTVRLDYLNTQGQPKFVWPPSFALVRSYVDQLERSGGLQAGRVSAIRNGLRGAEGGSAGARRDALNDLAGGIDADVSGSSDAAKVRMLAQAVRDLAGR